MPELSIYDWFDAILETNEISATEFEKIIEKNGLCPDGRNIGSIRQEFEKRITPDLWHQIQKRKQALSRYLDQTIIAGKAKNYMFPIMQKEFSLDLDFLRYTFPLPGFPSLKDSDSCNILAIGSCFAENIAQSLSRQGVESSVCAFPEDINSPIALLSLLVALDHIDDFISQTNKCLHQIIEDNPNSGDLNAIDSYLAQEKKRMQNLLTNLRESDFVILTLGNTLEWSKSIDLLSRDKYDPSVALTAFNHAVPGLPHIQYAGDYRRPASLPVVYASVKKVLQKLRSFSDGKIIPTVSPIPIRGVSGNHKGSFNSAITESSLSKSYLRTVLNEVINESEIAGVHYFPSFEIATDVTMRIPGTGFGNDDSNSRHLDRKIVDCICKFFVFKALPDLHIQN